MAAGFLKYTSEPIHKSLTEVSGLKGEAVKQFKNLLGRLLRRPQVPVPGYAPSRDGQGRTGVGAAAGRAVRAVHEAADGEPERVIGAAWLGSGGDAAVVLPAARRGGKLGAPVRADQCAGGDAGEVQAGGPQSALRRCLQGAAWREGDAADAVSVLQPRDHGPLQRRGGCRGS
ncbi:unnamed protein product, partial [Phaeothamnion confervicola]